MASLDGGLDDLPGLGTQPLPRATGVWLPWTGKQLRTSTTDLPIVRRSVVIGSLTVSP